MEPGRPLGRRIIRAVIAGSVAAGAMLGIALGQETVYVVNVASNDVSVIDPSAGAVVATIPVGRQPNGIAVTPDGHRVYVSNLQDDTVSVIDAGERAVVHTISVGDEPVGIAIAPDGSRAYVTNRRSNTVSVVDTAANAVVATIADGVGPGSNGIALTPDGGLAYVNNAASKNPGTLSVIDTALAETVGSIEVARNPKRVAIAPDGQTAYVANFRSWNISVVDLLANTFSTGLRVSGRTVGVAVHPNGQYAYVTNLDGTVEVLETANNLLTDPIAVGHEPYAVALSRQGGTAYVANLGDDTVSVVDLAADVETNVIPVGDKPFAVAVGCIGEGCDLPPFTPKPTRTVTPTPTITPTPLPTDTFTPDPNAVQLRVGPASGHAGETVEVAVTLDSRAARVAGVLMDLEYAAPLALVANPDHAPDCTVDPTIEKDLAGAFQPPGCSGDCSGARFLVLALQNVAVIATPATLFTCRVAIAADAAPGVYPIAVSNAGTSSPEGVSYVTTGIGAAVTVLPPGAFGLRAINAAGRCSGGSFQGDGCEVDADCGGGVCAQPSSVCDGGADDGLLCDCPGGTCENSGSCGGDASRGTCRGGRADGVCCDADFVCGGERPCAATVRVCAGGVAKGLPCLDDRHCPASNCAAPGGVCRGGPFDRFSCVDAFDCPAGACSTPIPVAPTGTPGTGQRPNGMTEPTLQPAAAGGAGNASSSGGGCAVVPTRELGYAWVLMLALIAARYGRRP